MLAASPVACLVDGSARMRERPMEGLLQARRAQGGDIACRGADALLPCELRGARLRGGEIHLVRPASSRFISALLLAAPLAAAPLRIVREQGSPARPYVDLTLACLRDFGAEAAWVESDVLQVSPAELRGRDHPDCVGKTFPKFFEVLAGLGMVE